MVQPIIAVRAFRFVRDVAVETHDGGRTFELYEHTPGLPDAPWSHLLATMRREELADELTYIARTLGYGRA
jgi:hypothetical protein